MNAITDFSPARLHSAGPPLELTLRDIPRFPPPWAFACAAGRDERRGRIAARRGFVQLKLCFMRAAACIPGATGGELQTLVRHASEPIELWLMRGSLLAALACLAAEGSQAELAEAQGRSLLLALQQAYPEHRQA